MPRRYTILDAFTDRPLSGNPLAVVHDSEGLDDARMQAIAREFNLSETVFVRPASNPAHAAAIRIFTPGYELPFAGHPTIGAAVQLALDAADGNHNKHEMMLVLEEEIGPIRCGVSLKGNAAGHVIFDLPKMPATTVDPADRDLVAAGLGLAPTDIGFENHVPTGYDAGVPYCFVPVRDLDAIARARPEMPHYDRAFGDDVLADVFVYTRETVGAEHHFHARMFAPKAGIPEDPATGSGVAGLAGVIARFDQPPGGSHRYLIEQGYEMGRPSLIGLEIDMHDGAVHGGRISGDAVVVAEGTLSI
ncbi:MAG: PhzF family phenazine biosynthesis protein [Bauldia sp.]|uniref:PhzF family phenazine biosynthesis protein n=1 Tax=Bauldia sp. TaxID=2575872 RepID=UPI001D6F69C5|nr:PhzF family phenazine biosynthesis protein [Bauldia sp.]MCB1494781.1 PhzF family phenazine biosynthesis protein [Bauldia sp.]